MLFIDTVISFNSNNAFKQSDVKDVVINH